MKKFLSAAVLAIVALLLAPGADAAWAKAIDAKTTSTTSAINATVAP